MSALSHHGSLKDPLVFTSFYPQFRYLRAEYILFSEYILLVRYMPLHIANMLFSLHACWARTYLVKPIFFQLSYPDRLVVDCGCLDWNLLEYKVRVPLLFIFPMVSSGSVLASVLSQSTINASTCPPRTLPPWLSILRSSAPSLFPSEKHGWLSNGPPPFEKTVSSLELPSCPLFSWIHFLFFCQKLNKDLMPLWHLLSSDWSRPNWPGAVFTMWVHSTRPSHTLPLAFILRLPFKYR